MIRSISLCMLVLSLIPAWGCSKSSQVADGVEAKPTKIERGTSITMGMASATAQSGNDLVRIFFEIKATPNVKEVKVNSNEQELVDSDGKSYKAGANLTFHFGSNGGTMTMDSMFELPQTATLRTFKLGHASFDISSLEGAKPGSGQK